MELKTCKDEETIKNKQADMKMSNTELSEMKIKLLKLKIQLNGLNSRLDMIAWRIGDLEYIWNIELKKFMRIQL